MSPTPSTPDAAFGSRRIRPDECDERIHSHLYLVEQIARTMHRRMPRSVQLDDLRSDGTLGLLAAARSFDPRRGVSFATYASHRIRGAIFDGLRAMDWVPKSRRAKLRTEAPVRNEPIADGHNPQETPISRGRSSPGVTIHSFDLLLRSEPTLCALRDHTIMPDIRLEARETLAGLFRQLSGNARRVIYFKWIKELEQRQIARRWSVSEARISVLHTRAMKLLIRCANARNEPEDEMMKEE